MSLRNIKMAELTTNSHKQTIKASELRSGLADSLGRKIQLDGNVFRNIFGDPSEKHNNLFDHKESKATVCESNGKLENGLWVVLCNGFDVHTTLSRCYHHRTL